MSDLILKQIAFEKANLAFPNNALAISCYTVGYVHAGQGKPRAKLSYVEQPYYNQGFDSYKP